MGRIKLIALDIDLTLTVEKDIISERNLKAIREAQQAGIFVTIATGRGFLSSRKIWKALEIEGPTIQYGGAMLVHSPDGTPIEVHGLAPETVAQALQIAHELGIHIQIFDGDTVVTEKDCAFFDFYHKRTDLPFRIEPDLRQRQHTGVPKALAYAEPEQAGKLAPVFAERLRGLAGVTISSPGFIEINTLGTNKGIALARMAEMLGIRQEETAALGDGTIDLSMIRWAGDGVAVDNAVEAVKAEANIIVPSCADDGVAYYIEHYCL